MVRGVRGSGAKGNRYNPKTKSLGTNKEQIETCLLYTSPSPRDRTRARMPSSA